jgi:hypothetical protein
MKYDSGDSPLCTVICILGKGYWFYDSTKKDWFGIDTSSQSKTYLEFCTFVTGFINTLAEEEMTFRPFLPGSYVDPISGIRKITGIKGNCIKIV